MSPLRWKLISSEKVTTGNPFSGTAARFVLNASINDPALNRSRTLSCEKIRVPLFPKGSFPPV